MRGLSRLAAALALTGALGAAPGAKDAAVDDPALLSYVQGLEQRLAAASGEGPLKVRVTLSDESYARLLPPRTLSISRALFARLENEAELAGLLAHIRAHGKSPAPLAPCSLASARPAPAERRESEMRATQAAVGTLKRVGYDPSALLDLLSKLAYEHPGWAAAIVPDDVLRLRTALEKESLPPRGYVTDSSEFIKQHAKLAPPARAAVRK